MKKRFIAISLLLAFLGIAIHGIIPHHHHDLTGNEQFSHHHHENNNQQDDTDHHRDQPLPFPGHQHVSGTGNFDIARTYSVFNRYVVDSCYDSAHGLLFRHLKPDPPGKIACCSFANHFTSFIFLSPNSLRGSPVIA